MKSRSMRSSNTADSVLRVHEFIPLSHTNGPGARAVVWLQGCSLACPGCFNPETHSFEAGRRETVEDVLAKIQESGGKIEGVTISGGEPLQQPAAVLSLVQQIRKHTELSILMFSGFSWDEIQSIPQSEAILQSIDLLIAGRFQIGERLATGLIGSANKSVHFLTRRYGPADLACVPHAEVIIKADGTLVLTGIDPVKLEP